MNQLQEVFFDSIDDHHDKRKDTDFLIECFNIVSCDISDPIILLDAEGVFVASNNSKSVYLSNKRFKYIDNIHQDEETFFEANISVHIRRFKENQPCPGFYILQLSSSANLNTQYLGRTLQKIYQMTNSYKTEYENMLMYLNAIEEGISAVNKEGILIYANDTCCKILGVEKENILNRKADRLCKNRPLLFDILKTKKSKIDSEYFIEYDNRIIHLTSSGYPVLNDRGELLGAIDIFRSIKRSRKLANSMVGNEATFEFSNIIGSSNQALETIEIAKQCALNNENILIEGESGTGKELFAQSIHNYSNRNRGPFIAVNCASLPIELVESELFGYEEGTFTGAKKGGKTGKFELASGGTLFLDEIGEMPIQLQAKLLRAVEYKIIHRIGSTRPINVDVRIIAATNRDLKSMVREGKFRGDLYYRLKVLYLRIPPLREREGDIIELADYFIKKNAAEQEKQIDYMEDQAKAYLLSYNWPGNIRELENSISRAIFLSDGNSIKKEDLIKAGIIGSRTSPGTIGTNSKRTELNYYRVKEVYTQVSGNKKRAAEILGISRPTLYKLIRRYHIDD